MTLNISFTEIATYVEEHYKQKVTISRVADQELCIALQKKIIFYPVSIPLNLSMSVPCPNSIHISYYGKTGVELIVDGVVSFLKARVPILEPYLADVKDQSVTIKLESIGKLKPALEYVSLTDIKVAEERLTIVLSLR